MATRLAPSACLTSTAATRPRHPNVTMRLERRFGALSVTVPMTHITMTQSDPQHPSPP